MSNLSLQLYTHLCNTPLTGGKILFQLSGITCYIKTTDSVGFMLQSWVKEFLQKYNYSFDVPNNTQEFPDFILLSSNYSEMLEIKSFNYSKSPAFDIANFDSYCNMLIRNPEILYANYLIFGYDMDMFGNLEVKKIWLKKIWEIAGISKRYRLKTQVKQDVIYNIRPINFKNDYQDFQDEWEFIEAIKETLVNYKDASYADNWNNDFNNAFHNRFD